MQVPGGAGGAAATAGMMFARYFSRKCSPNLERNLRRVNPKVPREEASVISQGLYQVIKDNGPLTVSNTWNHAKEAGINGLNSKTHMKILLKWMRGRKMLKLFCTHIGSSKKFLHSTLPEDPQAVLQDSSTVSSPATPKRSGKKKKQTRKKKAK